MKDTIRYTSCSYHCLNACPIKVHVRDGVIKGVEPDDTIPDIPRDVALADRLIDKGMYPTRACVKGYSQWRIIYDPARVKYPLKRAGKRGEGKFVRISWDEALDTIIARMQQVKRDYGPHSIMHHPYSNHGSSSFPLVSWFGAGVAGWDAHSLNGWVEPERWVLGKDYSKGSSLPDLSQDEANLMSAKLIVLWGLNPAATFNGGRLLNFLRAKERGIPIICIDSRYTPSAETIADQWIPIRPTTDVAMMIAMANVWFKEDLCDNDFTQKYVEPEGLARWKRYVLGEDDKIDKDARWAEGICGVPVETITAFARLYARSKPVNLSVSGSIGRQFFGENPTRASMYLQSLTGNICIPGGTAAAETGLQRRSIPLPKPVVDWQRKPGSYVPPTVCASYKYLKAIDLRDRLDKGEMSAEAYNLAIGNPPQNVTPNIKLLLLESNNHPTTLPDMNSNIRALNKLDCLVTWSYFTDTAAAKYADIILPQIATAYEGRHCVSAARYKDLFLSGSFVGNYFLYRQKCVEAPAEVKSGDWVWVQLAKRLGFAEQYSPRLANVSDDEWDQAIEDIHQDAYEKWAQRKDIMPLNPPSWADFQKKPIFRREIKEPHYPFKEEMETGQNPFRGTDSGKIEFYSKGLGRGPEYLASVEFFPNSSKCYGAGNLPPMAGMSLGGKDTYHSKDTLKYPLLMSSPHSYYRIHSLLDNNYWLRDDCYRHAAWLSLPDARARNIKDGDMVRVYNDIGEMVIPAYVTSKVVPGTVCVFHGSWYRPDERKSPIMPEGIDTGGASNFLIHNEDQPDTIVGFFPCKGLVEIEKYKAQ